MLSMAVRNTGKLVRRYTAEGVRLGRYFTKKEKAAALSEALRLPKKEGLSVLIPGGGTGILAAAMLEAAARLGGVREILLDVYETDERFLPSLEDNLERLRKRVRHDHGIRLKNRIHSKDFFTIFGEEGAECAKYDLILLHPDDGAAEDESPADRYRKRSLPGAFDLPTLFLSAALTLLSEGGCLSAIMPLGFAESVRSAPLRRLLAETAPLSDVTLYEEKGPRKETEMGLTFLGGEGAAEVSYRFLRRDGTLEAFPLERQTAVYSEDCRILLLAGKEDLSLLSGMKKLPQGFARLGLSISTGLVIENRHKESLRRGREDGAVPLLHPAGIREGRMVFPARGREYTYIVPRIPSLSQENCTLLCIKRVPSKRENRHLVCGVYLPGQLPRDKRISTANKLEIIKAEQGEMSADFAVGLSAILSSSLYERYCSLLGTMKTVTRATLETLPLPPKEVILTVGKRLSVVKGATLRAQDAVATAALSSYFATLPD